jgi:hypothetical protein
MSDAYGDIIVSGDYKGGIDSLLKALNGLTWTNSGEQFVEKGGFCLSDNDGRMKAYIRQSGIGLRCRRQSRLIVSASSGSPAGKN